MESALFVDWRCILGVKELFLKWLKEMDFKEAVWGSGSKSDKSFASVLMVPGSRVLAGIKEIGLFRKCRWSQRGVENEKRPTGKRKSGL